MDAMKAILSRRSIRQFSKEPVSDKDIKELLEAAMRAPSALNEQPWHFIVITDREVLDAIPRYHPYSHMLKEVSVAIMVCGDFELEKREGFLIQDCSAATQNILIAIQAKGLGGVWLGVYPLEERMKGIRKLVNLPDHVIPLCVIPVGHPAEHKPPEDRYDASRIHYDQW